MEQHLDTILDQAEQTGQAPAEVVVRLLKADFTPVNRPIFGR